MLYTYAAAALLGASIAAVGAWQVQSWRYTGQINQIRAAQAEAVNTATREARAQESARFKGVQDAQAAAQTRAQVARRDADRARSELDRLRDNIRSASGGVPGESPGACAVRADAAGELLAQCAGAYQWLAEVADRLNADRLMLMEAWPK
jgi:hypothetical protein